MKIKKIWVVFLIMAMLINVLPAEKLMAEEEESIDMEISFHLNEKDCLAIDQDKENPIYYVAKGKTVQFIWNAKLKGESDLILPLNTTKIYWFDEKLENSFKNNKPLLLTTMKQMIAKNEDDTENDQIDEIKEASLKNYYVDKKGVQGTIPIEIINSGLYQIEIYDGSDDEGSYSSNDFIYIIVKSIDLKVVEDDHITLNKEGYQVLKDADNINFQWEIPENSGIDQNNVKYSLVNNEKEIVLIPQITSGSAVINNMATGSSIMEKTVNVSDISSGTYTLKAETQDGKQLWMLSNKIAIKKEGEENIENNKKNPSKDNITEDKDAVFTLKEQTVTIGKEFSLNNVEKKVKDYWQEKGQTVKKIDFKVKEKKIASKNGKKIKTKKIYGKTEVEITGEIDGKNQQLGSFVLSVVPKDIKMKYEKAKGNYSKYEKGSVKQIVITGVDTVNLKNKKDIKVFYKKGNGTYTECKFKTGIKSLGKGKYRTGAFSVGKSAKYTFQVRVTYKGYQTPVTVEKEYK